MKKQAKVVVATTLGLALLLSSSTYAVWNSAATAGTEAEILTGESDVKPLDEGLWTDIASSRKAPEAPPVIIPNIDSFRAVPSDEIGYSQLFNVKYAASDDSYNILKLTFDSDAGLNPAALKAKGITAQATVKDLDTGASASSDLTTDTLTTGYNFTGSLPAEGSRVEVSVNFKIDSEVSSEDTKNFKSLMSSSVLSVSGAEKPVEPPMLRSASLPAGVQGESYKPTPLRATGEKLRFAVTTGELPEGVNLNETTGVISGNPKEAGVYDFVATAKNTSGSSTESFSIEVLSDPPTIDTESLENAAKGVFYSTALSGTGSNATFTITEGSLPDGMAIASSTGRIYGTPTGHGSSSFSVTKTSAKGSTTKAFTVQVLYAAPTITSTTMPIMSIGQAYSYALIGTGEESTYAITSGVLPDGIKLDSGTGVFSGTTTVGGSFPFTVTKTNESGSVSKDLTIQSKAAAPKLTPPSELPRGNKDTQYEFKITATGDDITYSATGLPNGLSIDSRTGVISGKPTATGAVFVDLTATNSVGSDKKRVLFAISAKAASIVTETLPDGEVALDYSAKIETTDASTVRVTGVLPPGVTFNSTTATLSGKPTKSGTYDLTVEARNSAGSVFKKYSLYIETDGPVITTTSLPNATQNVRYQEYLAGKGENSTYAITAGELPPNFTLDSSRGYILATSTSNVYGAYKFTVTKTNEKGSFSRELIIDVVYQAPTITTGGFSNARIGSDFSANLTGVGNGATYSITSGALPLGVTLDSAGAKLSGVPTKIGDYTFTLTKTNTTGTVSKSFTITVNDVPPTISSIIPPKAVINTYYEYQLVAKGENLTYSVVEGDLPTGLTLNEKTGLVYGVPTVTKNHFVRFSATNSGGTANFNSYIDVTEAGPTITTTELPIGKVGEEYYGKIEATGEAVTYSGSTPSGLRLNTATGEITGKPTSVSSSNYTYSARNSGGTVTKVLKIEIVTQAPTITTETLPGATYNSSYNFTLGGEGSSNTYEVTAGALPTGLRVTTSGVNGLLVGTPIEHGVFNFTITKTNVSGTASKSFTLDVRYAKPTLSSATYPDGTLGRIYSVSPGGTGDFVTYSIGQGTLPEGLALNTATGVISGTPTAIGSNTFTLVKANVDGMASKEITVTVKHAAPTLESKSADNVIEAADYRFELGGTGEDVTYTINSGALPKGLSLNAATGVISGKTTDAVGSSTTAVIRKTNSGGTVVRSYTFNVTYAAPVVTTTEYAKATVNVPYSFAIQTTGKGLNYVVAPGTSTLPTGLSLNSSTGVISGTPTTVGTRSIRIIISNNGGSHTLQANLVVTNTPPTITVSSLPDATKGVRYSESITAGTGNSVTYSLSKGSLPAGISLSASGTLTGSVSASAVTSTFTIAKANDGGTVEREFTIVVK